MKIFNLVNRDTILWKQTRSIFLKGPESEPSNEIYVQSCTTSRDVWQRSLDPPKAHPGSGLLTETWSTQRCSPAFLRKSKFRANEKISHLNHANAYFSFHFEVSRSCFMAWIKMKYGRREGTILDSSLLPAVWRDQSVHIETLRSIDGFVLRCCLWCHSPANSMRLSFKNLIA